MVYPEQLEANRGEVILAAGEERPAGLGANGFGISLELVRCVLIRLESERVHKRVAAQTVPEQVLYSGQASHGCRAKLLTTCVEKVDDGNFAFDQVGVEPHRFVVLVSKH